MLSPSSLQIVADRARRAEPVDDVDHEGPHIGKRRLDGRHALENLTLRDAVRAPAPTAGGHVLQERLQPIERVGDTGLARLERFELFPIGSEPPGLIDG